MASIPWADKPYSLLSTRLPNGHENADRGSVFVFASMILAHNLTIRHLNAIYLQATGVHNSKDIQDFLFFCKTWVDELNAHHEGEEELLFPMLDAFTNIKGIMSQSEKQHSAFSIGVDEFARYVRGVTVSEYDGTELRRLIQGFADQLLLHLQDEPIQLLEIGRRFGGAQLKSVWDKFESTLIKKGLSKWDKHIILPLALGTNDHDFEDGQFANWPPLPKFVPFLIRIYYGKRHAGAWRFFPCWNSKKRDLEFVGEGWQENLELK